METKHCQNLIIGGGEAGKYLSWTLARQGQKTVVIERALIGGSCPNIACLPSKNIIHSAKVASLAARGAEFGLATGPVKVNMAGVFRRKQKMVGELVEINAGHYKSSGTELIMGVAQFTGPKTVQVALNSGGTAAFSGDRVFINVGSRASQPDWPGLADAKPMTHIEALNLQRLPEKLVILGGGYVALEFAQAFRRFGCSVTLIHRGDRLLSREDSEVSEALLTLLRDEGIEVRLKTDVLKVTGLSGAKVTLQVRSEGVENSIEATDILTALGRTPNTDRLNLEQAGVELDSRGYIRVNEKLETSAPGVWAMGECAGSPQFTHVSFDDFRIVRDNLAGGNRTTRDRLIPFVLFTDPELARVGLNESEAKAKNIPYRLARLPAAAILRTRTLSETRGFVKVLIGDDDRILGFTAFSVEAGEMLAAVQTAMIGGMNYTSLRDAIYTHPTMAEGLGALLSNVPAKSPVK